MIFGGFIDLRQVISMFRQVIGMYRPDISISDLDLNQFCKEGKAGREGREGREGKRDREGRKHSGIPPICENGVYC